MLKSIIKTVSLVMIATATGCIAQMDSFRPWLVDHPFLVLLLLWLAGVAYFAADYLSGGGKW